MYIIKRSNCAGLWFEMIGITIVHNKLFISPALIYPDWNCNLKFVNKKLLYNFRVLPPWTILDDLTVTVPVEEIKEKSLLLKNENGKKVNTCLSYSLHISNLFLPVMY